MKRASFTEEDIREPDAGVPAIYKKARGDIAGTAHPAGNQFGVCAGARGTTPRASRTPADSGHNKQIPSGTTQLGQKQTRMTHGATGQKTDKPSMCSEPAGGAQKWDTWLGTATDEGSISAGSVGNVGSGRPSVAGWHRETATSPICPRTRWDVATASPGIKTPAKSGG